MPAVAPSGQDKIIFGMSLACAIVLSGYWTQEPCGCMFSVGEVICKAPRTPRRYQTDSASTQLQTDRARLNAIPQAGHFWTRF